MSRLITIQSLIKSTAKLVYLVPFFISFTSLIAYTPIALADSSGFSFDCATGKPSIETVSPDLFHTAPRPFGRCSTGAPAQLYDSSSVATSDVMVISVDCKDKGTPVFQSGGSIECVLDATTSTPDIADVKVVKVVPKAQAATTLAPSNVPNNGPAGLDLSPLPKSGSNGSSSLIQDGLRVVFGILGAISLVVITLAGFKYVVSRGDPQGINKAKNTILYAVIGLMVAVSAQVIVGFVFSRLSS